MLFIIVHSLLDYDPEVGTGCETPRERAKSDTLGIGESAVSPGCTPVAGDRVVSASRKARWIYSIHSFNKLSPIYSPIQRFSNIHVQKRAVSELACPRFISLNPHFNRRHSAPNPSSTLFPTCGYLKKVLGFLWLCRTGRGRFSSFGQAREAARPRSRYPRQVGAAATYQSENWVLIFAFLKPPIPAIVGGAHLSSGSAAPAFASWSAFSFPSIP